MLSGLTRTEDEQVSMENNFTTKYLQILSQGIEEIWLDQSFTDVVVSIDGKTYNCHKMILSSLSQYFWAMFRSGMRESIGGLVELQNIDCETFETILRFMYTGCATINMDNVELLLEAAVMLQVKCLQEQCEVFLKKNIGPENCLGIWRLASGLNCEKLAKKSWTYILEFFSSVSELEEFGHLSLDDLIAVINDNDLNTSSEVAVCEAVMKWVEADPSNRQKDLKKLFQFIRFPMISCEYIQNLNQHRLVAECEECRNILERMLVYLTSKDADGLNGIKGLSRQFHHRQEEMMCVVGTRSRHPNPQMTEIKCFSFRRDAAYNLAALPSEPGACFAVTKLDDDVYVSGGYHGQTLLLRFVSSENKWQYCSPMLEGRWGHSMVSVDGKLFILGGSTRISETLSSVECYDPETNTCELFGGLQLPVSFMPTATIGHRIYIFGGKLQDRTLSTKIQCFDTRQRCCYILDDMPLVSSTASRVAVIENSVYIFYRHGDIMEYREGASATVVGNMPHFDHFGVVPHQGQILIVGSQSNQYSTVLYNPSTREMSPFVRTVKANLCNFYCLPVVMSRQYIKTDQTESS